MMDSNAGSQQPCYSSYINLREVGMNDAGSYAPPKEDQLGSKPVNLRRSRTFVFGCKHFPEAEISQEISQEISVNATWACEFCDGATLIEQASRSNEAVSSLDIDKLLCNFTTTYRESMCETNCARNAVKMGTWILRTRVRDTPGN